MFTITRYWYCTWSNQQCPVIVMKVLTWLLVLSSLWPDIPGYQFGGVLRTNFQHFWRASIFNKIRNFFFVLFANWFWCPEIEKEFNSDVSVVQSFYSTMVWSTTVFDSCPGNHYVKFVPLASYKMLNSLKNVENGLLLLDWASGRISTIGLRFLQSCPWNQTCPGNPSQLVR